MPFEYEISSTQDVLNFRLFGVITEDELLAYHELSTTFPKLERPVVIFVDTSEVAEWGFELNLERVGQFSSRLASRYGGTNEVIAMVVLTGSERMYGVARMMETYVREEFIVYIFMEPDKAMACVQECLAGAEKKG